MRVCWRVRAECALTGGGSRQNQKANAEKRIEQDLDDGVTVNYEKLAMTVAMINCPNTIGGNIWNIYRFA